MESGRYRFSAPQILLRSKFTYKHKVSNFRDPPMPHTFVSELKPGSKVNQYFLIKKKERRRTRGGKDYLDLILADRTGESGG